MPFWLLAVVTVLGVAVRYWRDDSTPLRLRFAVLILATLLVSPHLLIYDATVLVLPILFVWESVFTTADELRQAQFGAFTYGLFLSYFAPTAAFIGVQASVLLLIWLLLVVCSGRPVLWPVSSPSRRACIQTASRKP
jgi:hypothetical protein